MRISDWSSDVCSSDLRPFRRERYRPGIERKRVAIDFGGKVKVQAAAGGEQHRTSPDGCSAKGQRRNAGDTILVRAAQQPFVAIRDPNQRALAGPAGAASVDAAEIGRASCRERVCQYV